MDKFLFVITQLCFLFWVQVPGAQAAGPVNSLVFIENKGQWQEDILFQARFSGGLVSVKQDGLVYELFEEQAHEHGSATLHQQAHRQGHSASHQLKVHFAGSQRPARAYGLEQSATRYNYYYGKDPANWASDAAAYGEVVLQEVYPLTDFRLYATGDQFKYDFILRPGADPEQIQLQYEGADEMHMLGTSLLVKTPHRELVEQEPFAYQEQANGRKKPVPCTYQLEGNTLRFALPDAYAREEVLVIDPVLIFSTYSGSIDDNWGFTATFDDDGNMYSGGMVRGSVGNVVDGAFAGNELSAAEDVAILKYDSSGRELLYATLLGGVGSDVPTSMIVTPAGELLVMGVTGSAGFPVTANAFDINFNGGTNRFEGISGFNYNQGSDLFVLRLSPEGALVNATFLGGSRMDGVNFSDNDLVKNYGDQFRGEINTDAEGNAYIASSTNSLDIPLQSSVQTAYQGGTSDGVVFKLSPDLSTLLFGSYLGGMGDDALYTIKLNSQGDMVVAGGTTSQMTMVPDTAHQPILAGREDGIILIIDSAGFEINGASYLGTPSYDQFFIIDIDSSDFVYSFGQTQGNWPSVGSVWSEANGRQTISKMSPGLDSLLWTTSFGAGRSTPDISPTAFMVNACNNIYLSGWGSPAGSGTPFTGSTEGLTVTSDAYQPTTDGADFYFLVLSQDARDLLYATYFGDPIANDHVDGGTSRFSKDGIIYQSVCASCGGGDATGNDNFPTFPPDVWSPLNRAANCNNAAIKFDLATLVAKIQTNRADLSEPGYRRDCAPMQVLFENLSTAGERFEWDLGDGTITTQEDEVLHVYDTPGTYRVQLKAENRTTCRAVDFDFVTIEVLPNVFAVSPDDSICNGEQVQLRASGATQYSWSPSRGLSGRTTAMPIVSPSETTLYRVNMQFEDLCEKTDSVLITVYDPQVDFELQTTYSCFDKPSFTLRSITQNLETLLWDFGNGTTSTDEELVYTYPEDSGAFTISLRGTAGFCSQEKQVPVNSGPVSIPNVITPNSDGFNQAFEINTPVPVEVNIYDRWGKLIFEAPEYQNDWQAEGNANSVYYYEATFPDDKTCRGWLHVLK